MLRMRFGLPLFVGLAGVTAVWVGGGGAGGGVVVDPAPCESSDGARPRSLDEGGGPFTSTCPRISLAPRGAQSTSDGEAPAKQGLRAGGGRRVDMVWNRLIEVLLARQAPDGRVPTDPAQWGCATSVTPEASPPAPSPGAPSLAPSDSLPRAPSLLDPSSLRPRGCAFDGPRRPCAARPRLHEPRRRPRSSAASPRRCDGSGGINGRTAASGPMRPGRPRSRTCTRRPRSSASRG